jgi:hypothetical protein
MKKFLLVSFILFTLIFVSNLFSQKVDAMTPNPNCTYDANSQPICPSFYLGPDFCENGTIIPSEPNECGCPMPPSGCDLSSPPPSPITGCTEEAKVCPGGAVVVRSGPNCEFAPCPSPQPSPLLACTEEAKRCPDGSFVVRSGPNCEFAPCPSPAPSPPNGCFYQQPQCFKAPCDPILVCGDPAPSPYPSPTDIVQCNSDTDCQTNEYCYQPPMPICPPGMYCTQAMPMSYCKNKDLVIIGDNLPSEIQFTEISTTSRYPEVFDLDNRYTQVQTRNGEIGYARGFKFTATQGEKLETLVSEMEISTNGSYIRSHLYGPNKKRIASGDTRIDFTVSESGTFYLIANTFDKKEGNIGVQAYDKEQQKIKGTITTVEDDILNTINLPTYGYNISNIGRLPFYLSMSFPDTVYLKDGGILEYFSKESGRTIKVKPTLYLNSTDNIISLVQSRTASSTPIRISKASDNSINIYPVGSDTFPTGRYYGLVSETNPETSGVSGSNFYNYFAAISQSGKIADLNNDSKVNLLDYTILTSQFMSTNSLADINGDGKVNLMDFTVMMSEFSVI